MTVRVFINDVKTVVQQQNVQDPNEDSERELLDGESAIFHFGQKIRLSALGIRFSRQEPCPRN